MSAKQSEAAFAIMRATVEGKITPEAGETLITELLQGERRVHSSAKQDGETHFYFSGNQIFQMLPREQN